LHRILLGRNLALGIHAFRNAHKQKLATAYGFNENLKKDIIENVKQIIKRQNNEAKFFSSEGKRLEKEYKNIVESLEKLKKNYLTQSKECDITGTEYENIIHNHELSAEKKMKIFQKY